MSPSRRISSRTETSASINRSIRGSTAHQGGRVVPRGLGWGWRHTCTTTTVYPDCVHERTGTEKYTDAFATASAKIGSSGPN
ncbi:MAG: hypothetical protein KDK08_09765 [Rhizobiaceae bacterium]|nr:hypothetical protein [Rhizobiaceae bacterium]